MIRRFKIWRKKQEVKVLALRLEALKNSPFIDKSNKQDPEKDWPHDVDIDVVDFRLERARIDLAVLEGLNRAVPKAVAVRTGKAETNH